MEHLTVAQVNDYLDGELTPAEREAFARHAAECGQCQREIDAYQRVLSRLRRLPADFAPPADVYHGIVAAARRERQLTILARAAVILLLAGSAALSLRLAGRPAPDLPLRAESTAVVVPHPGEGELTRAYLGARDFLPPPSLAAVRRTIALLDRAIDDIRVALRTHPDDRHLVARLARAQQIRLRIMADAVNWSQATQQGGAT